MKNLFNQIEAHNVNSLTDLQLFSLLIGQAEAQGLFNSYPTLGVLARKEWKQIKFETLLSQEAAQITEAIFILSNRIQEAEVGYNVQITNPQDAVAFLKPKLRTLTKEVFYVLYLNNAKMMTGYDKISDGGATATIVDPAEVMRKAIINEANSILLAHNHPSGNKKESLADRKLTKRIVEAGKLLGISINDHIIIAGNSYTSFASNGLI